MIPAKTYEGQTTDAGRGHSNSSRPMSRMSLPDDKALYELDTLAAQRGKPIKRENAVGGMPVPLHPGAEKYYREVVVK
jgi:hypothetical protein